MVGIFFWILFMRLHEVFDIDEGIYDQDIFKFIFVLGAPGSGKSFYSRKIARGTGLRIVDSDMFFELIYKKQIDPDLKTMDKNKEKVNKLRQDIIDLNKNRLKTFKNNRLGFLFDGTGRDFNVTKTVYDAATNLGYEGMALIINCDLDEALRRNNERIRTEDPEFIRKAYADFKMNIPKLKTLFGNKNIYMIDNTDFEKGNDMFNIFFKKMRVFLNKKVNNKQALDWINLHTQQRTG